MTKTQLKKATNRFINHVRKNYDPTKPLVFWIDLFCGAGGTSTGIHLANKKNVFVAACVNHDANAIKSHAKNHPFTLHCTEDITNFMVVENLLYLVNQLRENFPECKLKIWASLECTNFSKAKGGQARDADSRSLADHMPMYMALDPDVFWFENVEEFMAWGPMYVPEIKLKKSIENGEGGLACSVKFKKDKETKELYTEVPWKPISKDNGKFYLAWVETMKSFGLKYDFKILNAADFGAYQNRKRLFIQFPKVNIRYAWPEQTHSKNGGAGTLFDLPKHKAVKEVLNLQDEGISIFDRKKYFQTYKSARNYLLKGKKATNIIFEIDGSRFAYEKTDVDKIITDYENNPDFFSRGKYFRYDKLEENTEKRILAGLDKYVAKGQDKFIKKYFSGRPKGKVTSVDDPAGTIMTVPNQAVVSATHLNTYYGNGGVHDIEQPSPAVTTKDRIAKVDVNFLLDYQYNSSAHDIENPCPTLLTKDKFAKVDIRFIDQQYGNSKPASIEVPIGTLTGNPKFALVNPKFIINQYTGGGQHTDIDGPSSAVTNVPKQNLVSTEQWIMNTNFNNIGSSIEEPSKALLASRRYPYLINANSSTAPPINIENPSPTLTQRTHIIVNLSWFGHCNNIEEPSPTIIARQDKAPLYLLAAEYGPVAWIVFEDDSETMIKIKRFMVEYGITDIKMRMLNIPELLQIQGFPKDYKLIGTKTEQKKYIGNAVEVNMAKALAFADYELEMKMAA